MATFGQFDKIGPLTAAVGGGWKLYHYVAGTTTAKDLWSDRGGSFKSVSLSQSHKPLPVETCETNETDLIYQALNSVSRVSQ